MNRPPAFQFYPDKWQSHTRRLSDSAYRVFHELICWMWQSSPDHCSIDASCEAVAVAVAMPLEKVNNAFAEINNAFAPLLLCENGKWVSNGLRKEIVKQKLRREKAQLSANARHNHANAPKKDANAYFEQCFPSPSPSPSPSTINATHTHRRFPSLEDVRAFGQIAGLPEIDCDAFWNHFESSGWIDKNGHQIANWKAKLSHWKISNQAKPFELKHHHAAPRPQKTTNSADLILRSNELKRVEQRISDIRMKYEAHESLNTKDREEVASLKKRRDELKTFLGFKA